MTYPDSSGGSDLVTFAYNAQGQEIYKKDQAGNVLETEYDTAGRKTDTRATTINTGAGFDDAVKRIGLTYLSRGVVDKVTQYDHATVGSGRRGGTQTVAGRHTIRGTQVGIVLVPHKSARRLVCPRSHPRPSGQRGTDHPPPPTLPPSHRPRFLRDRSSGLHDKTQRGRDFRPGRAFLWQSAASAAHLS